MTPATRRPAAGPPRQPAPQSSADMALGIATLTWAISQVLDASEPQIKVFAWLLANRLADAGWEIRRLPPCETAPGAAHG